eukprot:CAMPEP_0117891154 /NCGR_PEP_ID=MMETSP0950-20121206/23782_1 /TAXON_ID=44440 /ORGANISM="Chattonella subsalsa, Strain CCMP2191" /LENGTH=45 /DNA_ID= /DNA_START= /DNA_END= /DNA_ORIENTATION=
MYELTESPVLSLLSSVKATTMVPSNEIAETRLGGSGGACGDPGGQ